MRKPRSDSLLRKMPQDQQDALSQWLLGGMRYSDAVIALKERFNVQTCSSSICRFWEDVCGPKMMVKAAAGVCLLQIVVEIEQPNKVRIKILTGGAETPK